MTASSISVVKEEELEALTDHFSELKNETAVSMWKDGLEFFSNKVKQLIDATNDKNLPHNTVKVQEYHPHRGNNVSSPSANDEDNGSTTATETGPSYREVSVVDAEQFRAMFSDATLTFASDTVPDAVLALLARKTVDGSSHDTGSNDADVLAAATSINNFFKLVLELSVNMASLHIEGLELARNVILGGAVKTENTLSGQLSLSQVSDIILDSGLYALEGSRKPSSVRRENFYQNFGTPLDLEINKTRIQVWPDDYNAEVEGRGTALIGRQVRISPRLLREAARERENGSSSGNRHAPTGGTTLQNHEQRRRNHTQSEDDQSQQEQQEQQEEQEQQEQHEEQEQAATEGYAPTPAPTQTESNTEEIPQPETKENSHEEGKEEEKKEEEKKEEEKKEGDAVGAGNATEKEKEKEISQNPGQVRKADPTEEASAEIVADPSLEKQKSDRSTGPNTVTFEDKKADKGGDKRGNPSKRRGNGSQRNENSASYADDGNNDNNSFDLQRQQSNHSTIESAHVGVIKEFDPISILHMIQVDNTSYWLDLNHLSIEVEDDETYKRRMEAKALKKEISEAGKAIAARASKNGEEANNRPKVGGTTDTNTNTNTNADGTADTEGVDLMPKILGSQEDVGYRVERKVSDARGNTHTQFGVIAAFHETYGYAFISNSGICLTIPKDSDIRVVDMDKVSPLPSDPRAFREELRNEQFKFTMRPIAKRAQGLSFFLVENIEHFHQVGGFDTITEEVQASSFTSDELAADSLRLLRPPSLCIPYAKHAHGYMSGVGIRDAFFTALTNIPADAIRSMKLSFVDTIASVAHSLQALGFAQLPRTLTDQSSSASSASSHFSDGKADLEIFLLQFSLKYVECSRLSQRLLGVKRLVFAVDVASGNVPHLSRSTGAKRDQNDVSKAGGGGGGGGGGIGKLFKRGGGQRTNNAINNGNRSSRASKNSVSRKSFQPELYAENAPPTFNHIQRDWLLSFLASDKVIQLLFQPDLLHLEVIRRATKLLLFLAEHGKLMYSHMLTIWAACLQKEEALMAVLFSTLVDLVPKIPAKDRYDFFEEQVAKLPLDDYDDSGEVLRMAYHYTVAAVHADRHQGVKDDKQTRVYGLEVLWTFILDNSNRAAPPAKDLLSEAMELLVRLVSDHMLFASKRWDLMARCMTNVKKGESVTQSLILLENIINTFPRRNKRLLSRDKFRSHPKSVWGVLEALESKHKMIPKLLESVESFSANCRDQASRGITGTDLDEASPGVSCFTNMEQLLHRLSFLAFALTASNLSLSKKMATSLWDATVKNCPTPGMGNLALLWFSRLLTMNNNGISAKETIRRYEGYAESSSQISSAMTLASMLDGFDESDQDVGTGPGPADSTDSAAAAGAAAGGGGGGDGQNRANEVKPGLEDSVAVDLFNSRVIKMDPSQLSFAAIATIESFVLTLNINSTKSIRIAGTPETKNQSLSTIENGSKPTALFDRIARVGTNLLGYDFLWEVALGVHSETSAMVPVALIAKLESSFAGKAQGKFVQIAKSLISRCVKVIKEDAGSNIMKVRRASMILKSFLEHDGHDQSHPIRLVLLPPAGGLPGSITRSDARPVSTTAPVELVVPSATTISELRVAVAKAIDFAGHPSGIGLRLVRNPTKPTVTSKSLGMQLMKSSSTGEDHDALNKGEKNPQKGAGKKKGSSAVASPPSQTQSSSRRSSTGNDKTTSPAGIRFKAKTGFHEAQGPELPLDTSSKTLNALDLPSPAILEVTILRSDGKRVISDKDEPATGSQSGSDYGFLLLQGEQDPEKRWEILKTYSLEPQSLAASAGLSSAVVNSARNQRGMHNESRSSRLQQLEDSTIDNIFPLMDQSSLDGGTEKQLWDSVLLLPPPKTLLKSLSIESLSRGSNNNNSSNNIDWDSTLPVSQTNNLAYRLHFIRDVLAHAFWALEVLSQSKSSTNNTHGKSGGKGVQADSDFEGESLASEWVRTFVEAAGVERLVYILKNSNELKGAQRLTCIALIFDILNSLICADPSRKPPDLDGRIVSDLEVEVGAADAHTLSDKQRGSQGSEEKNNTKSGFRRLSSGLSSKFAASRESPKPRMNSRTDGLKQVNEHERVSLPHGSLKVSIDDVAEVAVRVIESNSSRSDVKIDDLDPSSNSTTDAASASTSANQPTLKSFASLGVAGLVRFGLDLVVTCALSGEESSSGAEKAMHLTVSSPALLKNVLLFSREEATRQMACSSLEQLCARSMQLKRECSGGSVCNTLLNTLFPIIWELEAASVATDEPWCTAQGHRARKRLSRSCGSIFDLAVGVMSLSSRETKFRDDITATIDAKNNFKRVTHTVMAHTSTESQNRPNRDFLLSGWLDLLSALARNGPLAMKGDASSLGLIDFLYSDCLFPKADDELPKCIAPETREAAFGLLTELSEHPSNVRNLLSLSMENGFGMPASSIKQENASTEKDEDSSKTSKKAKTGKPRALHEWKYDPEMLARFPLQYAGLRNQGATCYMNSLVQQMYHVSSFSSAVATLNVNDRNSVLAHLQTMFASMSIATNVTYETKPFCQSLKDIDGSPLRLSEQKDVQEFSNLLFDTLESESSEAKALIEKNFGGNYLQQIISKDAEEPYKSERTEPFTLMQLDIKNKESVVEALDSFVLGDRLAGDNRYELPNGKKVEAVRRYLIKDLPPHLLLSLKRFEFNYETMTKAKLHDHCAFPLELDMEPYTYEYVSRKEREHKSGASTAGDEDDTEDAPRRRGNNYYTYELVGVLAHSGTADSGHYYSFIRERTPLNPGLGRQWYEFNDQMVWPYPVDRMPFDCFGGYDTIDRGDGKGTLQIPRQQSAYILVYDRKSMYGTNQRQMSLDRSFLASSNSTSLNYGVSTVESSVGAQRVGDGNDSDDSDNGDEGDTNIHDQHAEQTDKLGDRSVADFFGKLPVRHSTRQLGGSSMMGSRPGGRRGGGGPRSGGGGGDGQASGSSRFFTTGGSFSVPSSVMKDIVAGNSKMSRDKYVFGSSTIRFLCDLLSPNRLAMMEAGIDQDIIKLAVRYYVDVLIHLPKSRSALVEAWACVLQDAMQERQEVASWLLSEVSQEPASPASWLKCMLLRCPITAWRMRSSFLLFSCAKLLRPSFATEEDTMIVSGESPSGVIRYLDEVMPASSIVDAPSRFEDSVPSSRIAWLMDALIVSMKQHGKNASNCRQFFSLLLRLAKMGPAERRYMIVSQKWLAALMGFYQNGYGNSPQAWKLTRDDVHDGVFRLSHPLAELIILLITACRTGSSSSSSSYSYSSSSAAFGPPPWNTDNSPHLLTDASHKRAISEGMIETMVECDPKLAAVLVAHFGWENQEGMQYLLRLLDKRVAVVLGRPEDENATGRPIDPLIQRYMECIGRIIVLCDKDGIQGTRVRSFIDSVLGFVEDIMGDLKAHRIINDDEGVARFFSSFSRMCLYCASRSTQFAKALKAEKSALNQALRAIRSHAKVANRRVLAQRKAYGRSVNDTGGPERDQDDEDEDDESDSSME